MKKVNLTEEGGSDSLAFNHSFCHPEFISGSKDVRSRQQMLKQVQHDTTLENQESAPFTHTAAKFKAFTLAEVLITLAIIGVVAALTIPTVVIKYQKQETVTKLKKFYNQMMQAINISQTENAYISTWDFGTGTDASATQDFLDQYLYPHLKIAKNCGTSKGCFTPAAYLLNGQSSTLDGLNFIKTVFGDGSAVSVYKSTQDSLIFYFDTNGLKKPNTRGKDIFEFKLSKTPSRGMYFYPTGFENTRIQLINSGCNKMHEGFHCAALIMKDGWEIKEDYPW